VTKNVSSPNASGTVPTGRLGLRREFSDGYYVRTAAYAGFRQPSLNELYRPFRVGNITTNANADLSPEKLYGVEASVGRKIDSTDLSVTVFYNRINDAVANVTLSPTVRERENIDAITAPGVEAEAYTHWTSTVSTHLGLSYTEAKVEGGTANPTLTGLRPAQAPRFTATGSIDWKATSKLTLAAETRYESLRFDDDQNLNPLRAGGTVDFRVSYDVSKDAQVYATVGNAFNRALATAFASDGTISYDTPRTVSVGLTIRR
jgi:outer membrane receptor protein involved in Fe transport